MTLLVLAETSAGYALFKAKDKKLLKRDTLAADTETAEGTCSLLRLKQFRKFDSAATALEEASALVEGKVSPLLASLLDTVKDEKKASLAVADPKLGNAINKLPSISLKPISDSSTSDLYRAIRTHLPSLIPGLLPQDIATMSLGLSHSLSRHKLKFSPDKVDTMIVQAIALLDDLDKELNTYAMRVKEWYGWHFPEMGRIVNDNLAYARVILKMGMRSNASNADLADILPEEIEEAVKAAAEISMGTEITTEDMDNIQALAEQVVSFTEYRQQLSSYLSARMAAIAPNLTALVGELVGARLIAHAGSLINLAKSPASTIQILGAEKALFRALKTKHDTPKYGLIFHASLVGQATGKNKGKIARMVATKAAIGLRVDALSEWSAHGEGDAMAITEEEKAAIGIESRAKIERRLRTLEGKPLAPRGVAVGPGGKPANQPSKWEIKEARKYNADADGLAGNEPAAAAEPKVDRGRPLPTYAAEPKKDAQGDVKMIEEIEEESDNDAEGKKTGEVEDDDDEEAEVDEDEEDSDEEEDEDSDDDEEEDEDSDDDSDDESEDDDSENLTPTAAPQPGSSSAVNGTHTNGTSADILASLSGGDGKKPKPTKKYRKAERKAMRAAFLAEKKVEREEKVTRRLMKQERRTAKREASVKPADVARYGEQAAALGLSVFRLRKKLKLGEIVYDKDGKPVALTKKELKMKRKEAKKAKKVSREQIRKERKAARAAKAVVNARRNRQQEKEELERAAAARQESHVPRQAAEQSGLTRQDVEKRAEGLPSKLPKADVPADAGFEDGGKKKRKRDRDDADGEEPRKGDGDGSKKRKKKTKS
ncbi:MAG: H(+)-transporting V0 sector ATPase subunit d [Watsoniomyces obsoletus]|nr:MAG: H(+)-transporting V0 sector ATPase subunit d [Watsoniomyces obsoletus]